MVDRPTIVVPTPPGGWLPPWPNLAEIESVLPHEKWSLVGGLMTQLHGIHRGIDTLRPTSDVDMVLHIETNRDVVAETAEALESLGYELKPSADDRSAHRFQRGSATVELLTSTPPDVVDVLVADHAAPRVMTTLRARAMIPIEGGTQALKRTINARLQITPDRTTTVSVPSPFGAAVLKAAAYLTDSRDRERVISRMPRSCCLSSTILTLSASNSPGLIAAACECSPGTCRTQRASGGCCPPSGEPTGKPPCGS